MMVNTENPKQEFEIFDDGGKKACNTTSTENRLEFDNTRVKLKNKPRRLWFRGRTDKKNKTNLNSKEVNQQRVSREKYVSSGTNTTIRNYTEADINEVNLEDNTQRKFVSTGTNTATEKHADADTQVNLKDESGEAFSSLGMRIYCDAHLSVTDTLRENDKIRLEEWKKLIYSLNDESFKLDLPDDPKQEALQVDCNFTIINFNSEFERQRIRKVSQKCHEHCLQYFADCNRPCLTKTKKLLFQTQKRPDYINDGEIKKRIWELSNRKKDVYQFYGNPISKDAHPLKTSMWQGYHAFQDSLIFG